MKNKEPSINPKVYTPPNADLNYGNGDADVPKTEYENRKYVYRRKDVKNLTKGKYGKNDT